MSRWTSQNLGLMILSLLLAFFFWAAAIETEDPTRVDTFSASIPVEFRGLPETMTTYGAGQPKVRVGIRAPESVWQGLGIDDIDAYIDLTNVVTGTQEIPVMVEVRAQPADIQAVNPETVELIVEHISEKEIPVVIRVQGTPAMGFRSDPVEVAPQTLRVQGPESLVREVIKAEVSVSVEGRQNSLRGDYEPTLLDENENPVSDVSVVPKSVTVNIPVEQLGFIRDIPVTVGPLEGLPATGYRVANLEFDPPVVKVFGRTDVVQSVNYLQTVPISLEGITETLTARVSLQMLEGLSMIQPPGPEVTVTLTVEMIRSGLTLELTPTIKGLAGGLQATVGPDSVVVILSGPLAVMEGLNISEIEVSLDLAGLAMGEYVIIPRVTVPGEVDIENIIPEAVPVNIEARAEPDQEFQ
ncbi:MAG: CdaR family protein [Anaerolineae bacterium]|nr:CdaR family protein [Anaerolineae bacterium]